MIQEIRHPPPVCGVCLKRHWFAEYACVRRHANGPLPPEFYQTKPHKPHLRLHYSNPITRHHGCAGWWVELIRPHPTLDDQRSTRYFYTSTSAITDAALCFGFKSAPPVHP